MGIYYVYWQCMVKSMTLTSWLYTTSVHDIDIPDMLAPVITNMVNKRLQQGYFPAANEETLVTHALKKLSVDKGSWHCTAPCTEWHSCQSRFRQWCDYLLVGPVLSLQTPSTMIIFCNRLFTKMGIQGTVLICFKSYLDDRYQSVHVSSMSSVPWTYWSIGFLALYRWS